MFSKVYKYIRIFIITLVLLGHHSLQVQAMDNMHYHVPTDFCESVDCNHRMNMDICEQIQADEMQTSSQFFVLPKISYFMAAVLQEEVISSPHFKNIYERIPISYQQLARSHLS